MYLVEFYRKQFVIRAITGFVSLFFLLTGCATYRDAEMRSARDSQGGAGPIFTHIEKGTSVRVYYADDQRFTGNVLEATEEALVLQASGNYPADVVSIEWVDISKLEYLDSSPAQGLIVLGTVVFVLLAGVTMGWIDFAPAAN